MAGGELRLGTVATYMLTWYRNIVVTARMILHSYMPTETCQKSVQLGQNKEIPLPTGKNFGLNKRDGTFGTPVETADAGLGVVADFNKDGVNDMVTRTEVLLGKGDGTFQPVRYIPSRRGFPAPFAAADFDGDGYFDMAGLLGNEGDDVNFISVYRGKATAPSHCLSIMRSVYRQRGMPPRILTATAGPM